jgi:redox-sensitive bicupin YhaK (pirin superfamily)
MSDPILRVHELGFPWQTQDPFLFCVHHDDAYPRGNDVMGPDASLAGRELGMDFAGVDGWRMYHGEVVPGFPAHPHRGFETVTVVRRGLIDHSDSLGAAARYGHGDVQWLTAGRGIQHSEMFPLVERERPNPVELFQIWLNLPAADKLADPHFTMFWRDAIPRHVERDAAGKAIEITITAGAIGDARPLAPPPHSWAARPDSDVAIWTIAIEPGARWTLPPAAAGARGHRSGGSGSAVAGRTLYVFRGDGVRVADRAVARGQGVELRGDAAVAIENGPAPSELLLLQGRPIGEPVAQHGPFVMNTRAELQQAYLDYQRTRFGGWPWTDDAPVHPRTEGRFARHADGRIERAGASHV